MAPTRAQRRQTEVEYDTTAVPTPVQIGVSDVQEMVQDIQHTVGKKTTHWKKIKMHQVARHMRLWRN